MNILITGGLGYVGSVLSKHLSKNNKVTIIDKVLFDNSQYNKIKNKNINFYKFDILDFKKVEEVFKKEKINLVIHLAAIVGDPASKAQPELTKKLNWNASKKIFNLSKKFKVNKFFFFSTCSNYGLSKKSTLLKENDNLKPLSLYSKTKVDFEKFLIKDNSAIQKIILRISTLYGFSPRMRFDLTVNEFIKKMYYKEKLEIYHKDTWRPYLSLEDLQLIIKKLIKYPFKKNKVILNTGFNEENFSKKNIVDKIEKQLKFKPLYSYVEKAHFDKRNYRVDFTKLKKMKIKQKHSFEKNTKLIISYLNKINKKRASNKIFYNHK